MTDNPIVVMDSGIGGLNVLKRLIDDFPYENYIYLCDRKNMPYGNKTKNEVVRLCLNNLKLALNYNPKCIVIACNTMSLICGKVLRKNCSVPLIFIQPDIKKLLSLKMQNSLLLCTPLSATSRDISRLSNVCSCCVVALPSLATEIEECGGRVSASTYASIKDLCCDKSVVFLGCTHYIYLKKQLQSDCKNVFFLDGYDQNVEKLKKICRKRAIRKIGTIKFIGSGKSEAKNVFFNFFY